MTTDQAIRDAKARWMRRRRRLIGYGQWQPFVDAAPVRDHVKAIQATGMSINNLAEAAGVNASNLSRLLYPNCGRPPISQMRPETAATILAYWPRLDDYVDAAVIDATGTRRRLRALAATGWPVTQIHRNINICVVETLQEARFAEHVTARLARAVRDFYIWASIGTAEDHGIAPWLAKRGRGYATRDGWEGPGAWDEDTIDDPEALPDWTGFCGTDRGYWTHRQQKLPMCRRCEQAHDKWMAEREHLGGFERNRQAFAARAAASTREADLAHDGRELMRLGAHVEQAAARLGVTRQHLQQAMVRHPELEAAA